MEENLQDLKISGAGDAPGGKYNNVTISGAGDIKGDIECVYLKTSGAGDVRGNVKADRIETSGASDIKGDVECRDIKISGAGDIKGNVKAGKIRISGSSDIGGNLHAEEVEIHGCIDLKQECEVEKFTARGSFSIGGLLNAEDISIRIDGRCDVKEIGGEHIDVRIDNEHGLFIRAFMRLFSEDEGLKTDLIEGDDIYLEGTEAKIVRGNKIIIGKECRIGRVEYKDSINIFDNASVKEQVKL